MQQTEAQDSTSPTKDLNAPVLPPSATFPIGGRTVTLLAKAGDDLLDWGEILILYGQQLIEANRMAAMPAAKDSPALREVLAQMLRADIVLVCSATGWPEEWVWNLSVPERTTVIERQNVLNNIDRFIQPFATGVAGGAYAR